MNKKQTPLFIKIAPETPLKNNAYTTYLKPLLKYYPT